MRVGRNELCPCGSGKKFKNCHEGKGRERDLYIAAIVGAVVLLGVIVYIVRSRSERTPTSQISSPAPVVTPPAPAVVPTGTGAPQPIPAPTAAMPTPTAVPQSQSPGPAPAGKVWSPEHGHWHDVPAGTTLPPPTAANPIQITTRPPQPGPLTPQPPGPVPPGKVWSPEHGHWHDAPKQ